MKQKLVVILAVLLLAVITVLLRQQWLAWCLAGQTLEMEQSRLRAVQVKWQSMAKVQRKVEEAGRQQQALERLLPREMGESSLLRHLQQLAEDAGLELLEVRFGRPVQRSGYMEAALETCWQGRYSGLFSLLRALQHSGQRAVRLDEIKLERGRDDLPQLRAQLSGVVFYRAGLPLPAAPPSRPDSPTGPVLPAAEKAPGRDPFVPLSGLVGSPPETGASSDRNGAAGNMSPGRMGEGALEPVVPR
ncbi:MAG: type 4a pilus biogenesis protein PilO [Bacillota bacterium]